MKKLIDNLIKNKVHIRDPERIDIRGELECGSNVEIDINVIFEGKVILGNNVKVGANCIISNSSIGDNTVVKPFSMIEGAQIGVDGFVGPFGRIREGTFVGNRAQLGNFVEIKNVQMGDGCRINHMTYLGDSKIGDNVTIGAGSITCNYDGERSHQTIIEDNAFIGSGTNLVAPVKVGTDATVGSGSTITSNVPDNKLTIARNRQTTIENWARPGSTSRDIKK